MSNMGHTNYHNAMTLHTDTPDITFLAGNTNVMTLPSLTLRHNGCIGCGVPSFFEGKNIIICNFFIAEIFTENVKLTSL